MKSSKEPEPRIQKTYYYSVSTYYTLFLEHVHRPVQLTLQTHLTETYA